MIIKQTLLDLQIEEKLKEIAQLLKLDYNDYHMEFHMTHKQNENDEPYDPIGNDIFLISDEKFRIKTVSNSISDYMKSVMCSNQVVSYFIFQHMFNQIDKGDMVLLYDKDENIIEYKIKDKN